ncbi:hypothetical protein EXIGLDRAFT_759009 [Exidia glandulosa HHB12029]|uniref:Peptidase S54 rhomboid domain-containing protein n=1 Tax=Exidia glandulosa HHB12029 TaxID=1314781 RepID=A0A166BSL2_EXIGL|nr:hypothetical protein EXIGLDRAFT_759009 [Exidia glandulosa HHB12029]
MFNATRNAARNLRNRWEASNDFFARVAPSADAPVCRSPRILRRSAVFLGISCATVTSAAWLANEIEYRELQRFVAAGAAEGPLPPAVWKRKVQREAIAEFGERCKATLRLPLALAGLVDSPIALADWTVSLTDEARMLYGLYAVNALVFAVSLAPRGATLLARYMVHSGLSGKTYTTFTATYTLRHVGLLHLALNMGPLHLFAPTFGWIGQQDGPWDYLNTCPKLIAFWTVAGAFGAFVPNIAAVILQRRGIQYLPKSATIYSPLPAVALAALHPSVGASSAIYALLTVQLLRLEPRPDSPLGITPRQLLAGVLLSQALALPFLKFGGASSHLCGAFFGYAYYSWGQRLWEWTRSVVGNRSTVISRVSPTDAAPDQQWAVNWTPRPHQIPQRRYWELASTLPLWAAHAQNFDLWLAADDDDILDLYKSEIRRLDEESGEDGALTEAIERGRH